MGSGAPQVVATLGGNSCGSVVGSELSHWTARGLLDWLLSTKLDIPVLKPPSPKTDVQEGVGEGNNQWAT